MTWRNLLAVFLVAMGPPALADITLPDFEGRWRGDGQLAPGADRELQTGRCAATAQADPSGHALEISGRCAVVAGSARFVLRLEQDGGSRVRAATSVQGVDGIQQYVGTETDARIELDTVTSFEMNGRDFNSNVVIEFHSLGRFSIVERIAAAEGPDWRVVMDLDFTREGDHN